MPGKKKRFRNANLADSERFLLCEVLKPHSRKSHDDDYHLWKHEIKSIAFALESKEGFNVLQCAYNDLKEEITPEMLKTLQKAYYEKNNMSDIIYVMDIDNYMGDSVKQEIKYAKKLNRQIVFHSKRGCCLPY